MHRSRMLVCVAALAAPFIYTAHAEDAARGSAERLLMLAQHNADEPVRSSAPQRAGAQPQRAGAPKRVQGSAPVMRMASDTLMFDLPFLADDLNPGERFYNGKEIHTADPEHPQHWGYDISARRWDGANDRWTSVTTDAETYDASPTNDKWVAYGKRIYAVADGKVKRCWRNAPENPRPKISGDSETTKPWLHSKFKSGEIDFGGNFVEYELSDGSIVRHSHFITGSVPSSICPNNGQYLSAPNDTSATVVASGASIKAGQFLGKLGNAGNSTNPHLHLHREDGGDPMKLKFRRGLAAPYTGAESDIDNWTRFAGDQIPPGPVLIWPPRKLGAEYTRFKFPADDFGRMFDHLADSGFWPASIDGYAVGGNVFYNFVWTPAPGEWRGFFGQTQTAFNTKLDEMKAAGFNPVMVESYLRSGQVRYAAVYQKGKPGKWMVRSDRTNAQHEAILDEAKADGLNPINVSVVSIGGERRYTALYRADNIGSWQLKSQIKEADYQTVFNENNAAGRFPRALNAYKHGDDVYLVAIFASQPTGGGKARHMMSEAQVQSEFDSAMSAGMRTKVITAFDGAASQHRFAAIWRK